MANWFCLYYQGQYCLIQLCLKQGANFQNKAKQLNGLYRQLCQFETFQMKASKYIAESFTFLIIGTMWIIQNTH